MPDFPLTVATLKLCSSIFLFFLEANSISCLLHHFFSLHYSLNSNNDTTKHYYYENLSRQLVVNIEQKTTSYLIRVSNPKPGSGLPSNDRIVKNKLVFILPVHPRATREVVCQILKQIQLLHDQVFFEY